MAQTRVLQTDGLAGDDNTTSALMGGAKGVGGLSRVRGFGGAARLVWLLSALNVLL